MNTEVKPQMNILHMTELKNWIFEMGRYRLSIVKTNTRVKRTLYDKIKRRSFSLRKSEVERIALEEVK